MLLIKKLITKVVRNQRFVMTFGVPVGWRSWLSGESYATLTKETGVRVLFEAKLQESFPDLNHVGLVPKLKQTLTIIS